MDLAPGILRNYIPSPPKKIRNVAWKETILNLPTIKSQGMFVSFQDNDTVDVRNPEPVSW